MFSGPLYPVDHTSAPLRTTIFLYRDRWLLSSDLGHSALRAIDRGILFQIDYGTHHWHSKAQYKLVTKLNSTKSTFLKVDFERPCRFGPVHTGDRVERMFSIQATKSTELASMSTVTSCRIHVVADLSPKPLTQSTVSVRKSTVSTNVNSVARFSKSWLCRQWVLGLTVQVFAQGVIVP